ncbi:MAG: large subunit ribosomal protein L29 [Planctomycetota bacterium]|jgi:large subunit ribosomal protein L29
MNKAIEDIRGHDSADLKVKLTELRKEQFELRFRGAGEGSNAGRVRNVRRTIARIMTILGDRDRQAAAAAASAGDKN